MNWFDKFERKFGRYAIPHITRYMILANLVGYALYYGQQFSGLALLDNFNFSMPQILNGQIWRLVTWIFIPSSSMSIWTVLFVFCLLMLGESLEYQLGSFRMTVYFLGSMFFNILGGILVYLIFGWPVSLTLYYPLFSLYLMLGLFMPEAEVRLYFVLPIKMKYMIVFYAVMFVIELVQYFRLGMIYGLYFCTTMVFSLINLFIFVALCKGRQSPYQRAKQKVRQQQFRQQSRPVYKAADPSMALHKCVICGRTEKTNPELTFRYCSKCSGAKEYCNDHLFTHSHM